MSSNTTKDKKELTYLFQYLFLDASNLFVLREKKLTPSQYFFDISSVKKRKTRTKTQRNHAHSLMEFHAQSAEKATSEELKDIPEGH